MPSTRKRSFIKGVLWELSAPLVLFCFTQKWHIIVGYSVIRVMMYFGYERLWKRIKWGKF